MENKFQVGDEVFSKENPNTKLRVRRYVNRIYYCQTVERPKAKDVVFFENELMDTK